VTKKKFVPAAGAKFRTNAMFRLRWKMEWTGTLLKVSAYMPGCWVARVDGMPKTQYINEKWMEGTDE
jgi:hypothetical protein